MSKKKNRRFSASFSMLLMTLAAFLIIGFAIAASFAFDIFLSGESDGAFRIYLRRGDKRLRMLGDSEIMAGENAEDPLISASVLSQYCSYGIAGDTKSRTLVFPDGGYAEFGSGQSICINGENHFLQNNYVLTENDVYIPVSFYEEYIKGLVITRTPTDARLVIDIDINMDKFSLVSYGTSTETSLSVNDYFSAVGSSGSAPEFKTDLSEYEQYMNPSERDKFLFLVNSDNMLDKDYLPEKLTDLVHTRKDGRTTQQMTLYAAKAMEAMLGEAAANGYTSLSITSGYRSYNYQQQLFDNQVNILRASYGENARAKAAEAVAIPGSSEHQSGLCADLHNLPAANQAFADTAEYKWLVENCSKFGFILRYPKNKTDITGIMFEPWHYRFVGRYHAEIIMSEGLCLEEYMQMIKS